MIATAAHLPKCFDYAMSLAEENGAEPGAQSREWAAQLLADGMAPCLCDEYREMGGAYAAETAPAEESPKPKKTFAPKPFEAGARIEWRHFYPDGRVIVRAGVVWDRAPSVDGAVVVAWVIPDVPLPSDLYSAVAVGKSTRRHLDVHGLYVSGGYAAKGEAFSSNYAGSPTGGLAARAARHAHDVRSARAQLIAQLAA